jgi:hypothetical protein
MLTKLQGMHYVHYIHGIFTTTTLITVYQVMTTTINMCSGESKASRYVSISISNYSIFIYLFIYYKENTSLTLSTKKQALTRHYSFDRL